MIKRILRRRDAIFAALQPYVGHTLASAESMDHLALAIANAGRFRNYDVIRDSLTGWPTLTKPLSFAELKHLAGWFAGCDHDKQIRMYRWPFTPAPTVETVPVEVREYAGVRRHKHKEICVYRFRVLGGTFSTGEFLMSLPYKFLWILGREVGWPKRNGWSGNPREFVLLWMYVDLNSARDGSALKLTFERYSFDGECRRHNKLVWTHRRKQPCVAGFPWACHECPVGYDQCYRGTTPQTYEVRLCMNAETEGRLGVSRFSHMGWFEPYGQTDLCFQCRRSKSVDVYADIHNRHRDDEKESACSVNGSTTAKAQNG